MERDKIEFLYCTNCGAKVDALKSNFCTNCGTKLLTKASETPLSIKDKIKNKKYVVLISIALIATIATGAAAGAFVLNRYLETSQGDSSEDSEEEEVVTIGDRWENGSVKTTTSTERTFTVD